MRKTPKLRLSPNEAEAVIKAETNKWRIFRIQQVREQAREQASKIRTAVKEEENKQKKIVQNKLEDQWYAKHKEKVSKMREEYNSCLADVGQAHQRAVIQMDIEATAREQVNRSDALARQRGRQAMKSIENSKVPTEKEVAVQRRQEVMRTEKARAQKIAAKPVPSKFTEEKPKPPVQKRVMLHEAGTFTTTSVYVPKAILVKKESADSTEKNAKQAAFERRKEMEEMKENRKAADAQREKLIAQRANDALKREKVKHMYTGVMKQLANIDETELLHEMGNIGLEGRLNDPAICQASNQERMEKRVEFLLDELHQSAYDAPNNSCENKTSVDSDSSLGTETDRSTNENDISPRSKDDRISFHPENIKRALPHAWVRADRPAPPESSVHLKETVPLDKLAHTSDKYVIRVGSIVSPQSSSVSESREVTDDLLQDLSHDSNSIKEQHSAVSENSTPDQSSDASISVRKVNSASKPEIYIPQSKETFLNENIERKNNQVERARGEEWKMMQTRLKSMLEKLSPSSDDRTVTQDDKNDQDDILIKVEKVQSNRQKIDHLFNKLGAKSTKKSSIKPGLYVTPKKVYTQEIKNEGSNQKPVSKRAKFEHQKQLVVKHYLHRLLEMNKRGETLQLSSSDSTGITIATMSPFSDSEVSSRTDSSASKSSSLSGVQTSMDSSSVEMTQSANSSSVTEVTRDSSTTKSSSESDDRSRSTTTNSLQSSYPSSQQDWSGSATDSGSRLSSTKHIKYFDIDKIPIRESSSQETNLSPSFRHQTDIPQVGNDDPAVQRRLKELYSRLDDLKKLRQQLIVQEGTAQNQALPSSSSYENSSTNEQNLKQKSADNSDESYLRSTISSELSQFSLSTPGSAHTNRSIGGTGNIENSRLDGYNISSSPSVHEILPQTDLLRVKVLPTADPQPAKTQPQTNPLPAIIDQPLKSDEAKSSETVSSTDSSSIPDVSEFLKKLGFDTSKITTLMDKDSCASSN